MAVSFCLAAAASPAANMRPPPDRGSPPAPSPRPGQASRPDPYPRAGACSAGHEADPPRDAARSDAGKSHPSPMASATPTVQTNSRRLPSNRWRVFRNRRALRLHLSEQCRPIRRQCGLLHACDKKRGAQTEYCPCLPGSAGQVPAPPEQLATVARWPVVTVSAVNSMNWP